MKILIPTDYSENAFKAFEYVHALYADKVKEFIFINSQNARQVGSISTVNINTNLVEKSRTEMDKLIEAIRNNYDKINVSGLVTAGTFLDSVLEKAEEFGVDLIAIGTKGTSGIKEILMGSNTTDLIANAPKPLVIVPKNAKNVKTGKSCFSSGLC